MYFTCIENVFWVLQSNVDTACNDTGHRAFKNTIRKLYWKNPASVPLPTRTQRNSLVTFLFSWHLPSVSLPPLLLSALILKPVDTRFCPERNNKSHESKGRLKNYTGAVPFKSILCTEYFTLPFIKKPYRFLIHVNVFVYILLLS